MKLGCIIMAAGESRRFGENKLLQTFDGVPLYRRALNAVPTEAFHRVYVVTAYEPIASLAEQMGFSVISNPNPELGVSHTIRLGLEQLQNCDGAVFMTADQPLLTRQTLLKLTTAFLQNPTAILAVSHDGQRGNPCLFPRDLFEELMALQGDTGGSRVIRAHADRLQLIEVPQQELADCDTAQLLQALEQDFQKSSK